MIQTNPIEWDRYMRMPLNYSLAREKVTHLDFKEAAFQVSIALHEAIHTYFAVFGGAKLLGGCVSTRSHSIEVSGALGVIETDRTTACIYSDIVSLVAADVFEFGANGFAVGPGGEDDMQHAYIYSKVLPILAGGSTLAPPEVLESHGEYMTDEQISSMLCKVACIVLSAFANPLVWGTIRAVAIYFLKVRRSEDGFISEAQLLPVHEFLTTQHLKVKNGNTVTPSNSPTFRDDIGWLLQAFGKYPHQQIDFAQSMQRYLEERLAPQSVARLNALDTQLNPVYRR